MLLLNGKEVSSRPLLASFVSSHKTDVYRLHSRDDPVTPGLPFACAFTSGRNHPANNYEGISHFFLLDAKRGGVAVLAVATQDGTVELLNVGKRRDWDFGPSDACDKLIINFQIEPQRTVLQVHSNAILDAKWRMDDQYLVRSLSVLNRLCLTLPYL
jgi:denticleless